MRIDRGSLIIQRNISFQPLNRELRHPISTLFFEFPCMDEDWRCSRGHRLFLVAAAFDSSLLVFIQAFSRCSTIQKTNSRAESSTEYVLDGSSSIASSVRASSGKSSNLDSGL